MNIRQILEEHEPSAKEVFHALEQRTVSVRPSSQSYRYRFLSGAQEINMLSWYQEVQNNQVRPTEHWFQQNQDRLVCAIHAGLIAQGRSHMLLGAFRWQKRTALSQLFEAMLHELQAGSPLASIAIGRMILEHIGAVALLEKDADTCFVTSNNQLERWNQLSAFGECLAQRLKGTRIDWDNYLEKGLRSGKRKSYKPEALGTDLTAKDLLSGVDLLDKQVKGARRAYELASEFAHPNIGVHWASVADASTVPIANGLRFWTWLYSAEHPRRSMEQFAPIFMEFFEILVDSSDRFQEMDIRLGEHQARAKRVHREEIQQALSQHPLAFNLRDPCVCLSGVLLENCCGKTLKKVQRKLLKKAR